MAKEDMRVTIRDTFAALQHAQQEREKLLKMTEREAASNVVDWHAKVNGWPEQDIADVKEALGLEKRK